MSQLRRLAGQTAIYGVSSILGRIINYALVPLHTTVFSREAMGDVGVLFSLATYFLVVYTFGMETAFFRFVNKQKDGTSSEIYSQASTAVIIISTFFTALIFILAPLIDGFVGQPQAVLILRGLALILWIDAIMAIPFARLRYENRPVRFATIRVLQIVLNVGLQLLFLLVLPETMSIELLNEPDGTPGIGYIFLANLLANLVLVPLLWNYLRQIRFVINWNALKPMINYAAPIMVTGLAGMFNESIANVLLRFSLSDSFYPNMTTRAAVGVYSNTLKISVFMTLAVQAFRYAAEPFFFSQASEKDSPELFARVMHYFIIAGLTILFAVSMNVDLIGYIFLRKPEFRVALYLVPILLFAKLIYGIYMNLSIWFKLTDQTKFGLYFSVAGAFVTIAGNLLLIPLIGYDGSAFSMILCYTMMTGLCYFYGQQYYPIPYNFLKVIPYLVLCVALILLGKQIQLQNFYAESIGRLVFTLIILFVLFIYERKSLRPPADKP